MCLPSAAEQAQLLQRSANNFQLTDTVNTRIWALYEELSRHLAIDVEEPHLPLLWHSVFWKDCFAARYNPCKGTSQVSQYRRSADKGCGQHRTLAFWSLAIRVHRVERVLPKQKSFFYLRSLTSTYFPSAALISPLFCTFQGHDKRLCRLCYINNDRRAFSTGEWRRGVTLLLVLNNADANVTHQSQS